MKKKIECVKNRLIEKNASLVVMFTNGEIKEYYNKRVVDIVSILKENKNALKGAVVADKIIGKVAASLLIKGGIEALYANTLSSYGEEVLIDNGIYYECSNKTEYVINNDKTGMCPMENKFKDVENLDEIYDYFVK